MNEFPDYVFKRDGRVFSKITNKILKPSMNGGGYQVYRLKHRGGHFITKAAQRLFAEEHLEDYSQELQVNHIDGNKENNSVDNLEMVTASENMQHAVAIGLIDNAKNDFSNHGYKVTLTCLKTNKVTRHGTLGKALKYLGYSSGYTSWNRVKYTTRELKGHKICIREELIRHKK